MAKVLVVDDEVTMVQMVSELLRKEGHEVLAFSNGPHTCIGKRVAQIQLEEAYRRGADDLRGKLRGLLHIGERS